MTTETKFTVGEYKTRGGGNAKVFILNEDGTLVGARQLTDGSWSAEMWFGDGRVKVIGKTGHDLMPPLRECWRVSGSRLAFGTIEDAEAHIDTIHRTGSTGIFTITKYREVRDDQA